MSSFETSSLDNLRYSIREEIYSVIPYVDKKFRKVENIRQWITMEGDDELYT